MDERQESGLSFSKLISVSWVPLKGINRFDAESLRKDFSAGINVALLAFPQGMAYALIAGLPLHYGIFGSAIAALSGSIFSHSRCISLGPTNATSVLLLSAFAALQLSGGEALLILPAIILLSGFFLLVGSMARVASLVQYISRSVITGYITAAAILIIANQLKNIFGIVFPEGIEASTFFQVVYFTAKHIGLFDLQTFAVAAITALVFILLNRVIPLFPNVAITLLIVGVANAFLQQINIDVAHLEAVRLADWQVTLPKFGISDLRIIAGTSLAIAILSLLEGISIGKSLAAKSGEKLNVNQEMFNMGFANIGCAFFMGMPASGSLTRSMLNWKSGALTPLSSFFAGSLVLTAAFFLGPYIGYLPKASLAVLIISIGVSLIQKHQIFIVTHSTGSDKLVFYFTLLGGLTLPLDMAIYLGTGISIFLFLKKAAAPELVEYTFTESGDLAELKENPRQIAEVSIVHVEGDLFFGSAEMLRDQIRRVFDEQNLKIVILRMKNAHILDATCVLVLEELILHMKENDRHLLISGVRPKILKVLERSGILKLLGKENVFNEHIENPTFSTALAMKRAQEVLGGQEANVTIYVKPGKKQESV